jgi:hypothetical protein
VDDYSTFFKTQVLIAQLCNLRAAQGAGVPDEDECYVSIRSKSFMRISTTDKFDIMCSAQLGMGICSAEILRRRHRGYPY